MGLTPDMSHLTKMIFDEGIEKGVEKGIEKGIEKEKIDIAKNLLKIGVNFKTIETATGLSKTKISRLKKQIA